MELKTTISKLFREFAGPKPGAAVLVARRGKLLYCEGFGMADVEHRQRCGPETNFRLASVSKQFTAVAVMKLVSQGRLSLRATLRSVFPGFPPYGDRVEIVHLLSHTSGVIDYEEIMPSGTSLAVLDQDVLRMLMGRNKTYFRPGTKFRYSNSGYALLAMAVEKVSGMRFGHFLEKEVFEKLKMSGTLAFEEGLNTVRRRAYGYTVEGEKLRRTDQSITSSVLGDGGIYSSTRDLFRWGEAMRRGRLIGKTSFEEMLKARVATDKPGVQYGYGFYLSDYGGREEIWHDGDTVGFRTRFTWFPEAGILIVVLANRSVAPVHELTHAIADLVQV